MDYPQTIDYLFSRLPLYSRIGASAFKKDLNNTSRLCAFLGDPYQRFKSVHVAGTNGKGSVSHMLAAILQTAGYKTGLYTSPHLKDFRERIRIDGKMVSEEFVIYFTQKIKPLIEEISPSFFEITVAMAFDYFAGQNVDIAVVETGLGGRLDSTNIITPELSVITNIGRDHMDMLGDSLEKIAFEKAGIIKPGIPVVLGEVVAETKPVFEKTARENGAPVFIATQKRNVTDWHWEQFELFVEVSEEHKPDHKSYRLDLPGIYQVKNLVTLLEACSQLQQCGWKMNDEIVHKALRQVRKLTGLHGRWEVVHVSPQVVLEVAHNMDGIRQLIRQIEVTEHKELHIIFGMVKDKEVEKIYTILPKEAHYYFTRAQIPRAIPENELLRKAVAAGLQGESYHDVNTALWSALQKAGNEDLVLVCGSVFMVGEVNIPVHGAPAVHT